MTTMSIQRRTAHANRRPTPMHLFTIGQAVRLGGNFGTFPKTLEVYRITGTLPPRGDSPQYRIRNDEERHERVATQDSLEPILPSQSSEGATLIERTFGHAKGTETQQLRDQEAEAGAAQV
ncbi:MULTISPECIES: hypothetical protein [Mesorhizobium]|uniref:hypothetical protein n=1 Tax=Mesorhizobium TaxID=68287 RepID=UPI0007FE6E42|nr:MULTISPECIES: hypothetical protein [Mesorhizobium]MUT27340.1 hypothetical protein [Mesorhizobium japonicum]OBQ82373.1 hypothetical protein A9K71_26400 [Mesorhizobium sp. WSM3873]